MNATPLAWVVDDDRAVRLVLAAALREAGFGAREFTDAEAAIGALSESTPALLFTDVRMRRSRRSISCTVKAC